MKNLRTLEGIEVKGKRVLVRVDFNVPLDKEGKVADTTRLEASLPTISYLAQRGARVILMSHLGRPDPDNPKDKLKKDEVAKAFAEIWGSPVRKLDHCHGADVRKVVDEMKDGEVVLLENTRFFAGEKNNDSEFAEEISQLADLFVNDAFGTAHRAHASTVGVTKFLPAYAGFLLQREIEVMTPLLNNTPKPLVLLVGGAKIDTKIGILKKFMDIADTFLIGGGLANTFLFASGFGVGESLCQEDMMEVAQEIMLEAEAHHEKFLIPQDVVVASEISATAATLDLPVEDVEGDMKILDIGKLAIEKYVDVIMNAGTVIWNGPMGLYELSPFAEGTKAMAEAMSKTDATTILGGGDTIDAIKRFGHSFDEFTHVSTGGGAMLEFLEGNVLPGVEAVMD